MPENTTTHFAFPYPSATGKVNLGSTDIHELASRMDTVLWERLLQSGGTRHELAAASGVSRCTAERSLSRYRSIS